MKRFITLAVLALSLIVLGACNKETYVEKTNTVQVVSGKTEIAAAGGKNEIVLNIDKFTAKADDGWIKTAISANKLTLSAETNPSKQSRHTFVTVTAENGDFITIPVTQLGVVVVIDAPEGAVLGSYAAHSYEYAVKSNLPVEVSASEDWLHVALEDGMLKVGVDENTTGALRQGTVSCNVPSASLSESFYVVQAEFDTDIVGKTFIFAGLSLSYLEGETDDPKDMFDMTLAQLVKNGDTYNLVFPLDGWTMPVKVTASSLSMTLPNAENVGRWNGYYIFTHILDYAGGYLTTSKTPTMTATFEYDPEGGFNADIVNNGSWTRTADSYGFYAYKSTSLTSANRAGYLYYMVEPFLIEYRTTAGAAAMADKVKVLRLRK